MQKAHLIKTLRGGKFFMPFKNVYFKKSKVLQFDIIFPKCDVRHQMNEIIYRVNANDDIIFVDSNWVAFAKENGMCSPIPEAVVGTRLWKHIPDMTTRHFYQLLLEKVRTSKNTVILPFRCDSPSARRYMEMHVVYLTENELEFKSILLREEPRDEVKLLDPKAARSDKSIHMCLWCKKVKASDWVEVERALNELNLFDTTVFAINFSCCMSWLRISKFKGHS